MSCRRTSFLYIVLALLPVHPLRADEGETVPAKTPVHLKAPAGLPLRLYITDRVRMRQNQPVRARLIDPIYSFDRLVAPSGVEVLGQVTELEPVARMVRAQAMLNGDFTPLNTALIRFHSLVLPDGRVLPLDTEASAGLPTIYSPQRPKPDRPAKAAGSGKVRRQAQDGPKDWIRGQARARSRGVADAVRQPNKRERLTDFLISKLPWHPQWYRRGTRFDAVLRTPLHFGYVTPNPEDLTEFGMQPAADSVGQVRLVSSLTSADAKAGDPVEGVLSAPLFSSQGRLVLPEGTRLTGKVRHVRRARWFRRGGQLRFTFDQIEALAITAAFTRVPVSTMTQVLHAEAATKSNVEIDGEGAAKVKESKKRLLGPVLALAVAMQPRHHAEHSGGRASANYGGRSAGGFSGFGLVGTAVSRGSRTVGSVLGFYGLGWSVYRTLISRGEDVRFEKNASVEILFGARRPAPPESAGHLVKEVLR